MYAIVVRQPRSHRPGERLALPYDTAWAPLLPREDIRIGGFTGRAARP